MNIEQIYEKTLSFFVHILDQQQVDKLSIDVLLSNDTQKAYLYFEDDKLVFSIEGLYHYLKIAEYCTYNQYRRMLYNSNLNLDLSPHKSKIINHQTSVSGNVNLFSLVAI